MTEKHPQLKRVAILAYPDLNTFEFSCAVELFALERLELPLCYSTEVIATEKGSINAMGGFTINTDQVFTKTPKDDFFKDYDMIIIGGWTNNQKKASDALLNALIQFYKNGGTLVSFCGGAFLLAQTGLLEGKTATTHWMFAEAFKAQFPNIDFQENVLFTEEDRIYTSAGSAAGLDLGLHLIRKDFGASICNSIAKRMVISPQREGGQAQYANTKSTAERPDYLSISMQWASENLDKQITIDEMAQKACLSRRSFDRHFRNDLGQSPKEWLINQRIQRAREFLESSKIGIEQIAINTGFGTPMNLRHHFSQILGITPTHYRNQFLK